MNRIKEPPQIGKFISKSEAAMLQAVAVMLMVWHHLFGFPDRIHVSYTLVADGLFHIETLLSYFGRICIAIFAFSSGYGMRKKMANKTENIVFLKNYKTVLSQLFKFFNRYWIVYFVFIPLGFLLKVYSVDWVKFLRNVLGSGAGYNGEWWYVGCYVRFLLLFPVISLVFDLIRKYVPMLLHVLMAMAVFAVWLLPTSISYHGFLTVLLCLVEGMYFAETKVFETLYGWLPNRWWFRLCVGIGLFGGVFVLRTLGTPDYLTVALFVFAVMSIVKTPFIQRWLGPVLMFVGKYSTYVWLTHTFFGYYFFQKITFMPRYSWLIFLWCMVLSIAVGMVLERVLTLICKGVQKVFARNH